MSATHYSVKPSKGVTKVPLTGDKVLQVTTSKKDGHLTTEVFVYGPEGIYANSYKIVNRTLLVASASNVKLQHSEALEKLDHIRQQALEYYK